MSETCMEDLFFFFKRTLKALYCKHPSINKLMAMKKDLKNYSKGVMTVSNFSFFFHDQT